MRGKNKITLCHDEMIAAMQHYFDTVLFQKDRIDDHNRDKDQAQAWRRFIRMMFFHAADFQVGSHGFRISYTNGSIGGEQLTQYYHDPIDAANEAWEKLGISEDD